MLVYLFVCFCGVISSFQVVFHVVSRRVWMFGVIFGKYLVYHVATRYLSGPPYTDVSLTETSSLVGPTFVGGLTTILRYSQSCLLVLPYLLFFTMLWAPVYRVFPFLFFPLNCPQPQPCILTRWLTEEGGRLAI